MPCFVVVSVSQTTETATSDTLKSYEIEEVMVTGTRTYRKIIDVPYSVERIDNTEYKYERKTAADNVLGGIPGLFFQNRYGNHDVRISIRGFGSRSNSGIRGVRILLDGIPESEPDGQTRIEAIDFHSIGSIEIVKGNASSLYTNAPGGVINFINDVTFPRTFVVNFNEFGSFDLRSNGIKAGVRTENYGFLLTYNYHHAKGYRAHSEDYWHIANTVLESKPGDNSTLTMYGYFVDGLIRLPGSLTKEEFDRDPLQANGRDAGLDARRITKKGRVGLQFKTFLGVEKLNEVEVSTYGTIKYFERAAATYRIINRNGIGASARFVHTGNLFGLRNEFSIGGDALYQAGPVEDYQNIGGVKGDGVRALTDETIGNSGFYFQNSIGLHDRLDFLVTGRYDNVLFEIRDQDLGVRSATRRFKAFTPKAALNFKFTPTTAAYTSYGQSFDSPAANELDNYQLTSNPFASLLNPDLKPQKSQSFEIGVKGNVFFQDIPVCNITNFDVTFFDTIIEDEIVPFEIFSAVFFRNAARTHRRGIEAGATTEIVQGIRLKTAYTFSDFKYDSYVARSTDDTGAVIDRRYDGNVAPSVPKHNVSLSMSYERTFNELITGFVKMTYLAVSGMYTDDANSEKSTGYQIVNVNAGCDLLFGNFSILVSGGMNNIADSRYVAFININSTRKEFYEAGEPRNFFAGVNLGWRF